MFKIGEFSRLSHVPVKTLRYYDEIGLFRPVEVDRFTGYRYYSANQLAKLNRILALKGLGLSLDQITLLLQHDLPPEQIRGMLRLKQAEIEARLDQEQAQLARVEWWLRQIEQEEAMDQQEVVMKEVGAQTVASIRDTLPSYEQTGSLFGEIFAYLGQHGLRPVGPPAALYHDPDYHEQDVDVEVVVPVIGTPADGGRVQVYEMPASQMACLAHQGSYETIGASYGQVMAWIEANGYSIAGAPHEVYLRGPESGGDPSTYMTEIQVPVAKA